MGIPVTLSPGNKDVLVVGRSEAAKRRFAQLRRWSVTVLATDDLTPEMLVNVAAVFVATGSDARDTAFAAIAQAARIPVHVVDRPSISTFAMPAVVERGDIRIAISTSGSAPVLARRLKERIDQMLPARLGALAGLLDTFRSTARLVLPDFGARRRFWESIVDGPVGQAALAGHDKRARELLLSALNGRRTAEVRGQVFLVGGGPGDPELLTLKAHRVLQDADVVLYDDLIDARVLDRARADADRIAVGKRKGRHAMPQSEINALLIALARDGKRVVRLKGGDPFVFGRGGEEVEELRRRGIDVEIVPGVTAALGCAASAGFPLTHRDHASALTLVTGHGKDGLPSADWAALVRAGGTIAIYMGLTHAATIAAHLRQAGMAAQMPVAVIVNGTRDDERVSAGTLADLPVLAAREGGTGPALIVVGEVVRLAPAWASATAVLEIAS